jgi:hypothetical protein
MDGKNVCRMQRCPLPFKHPGRLFRDPDPQVIAHVLTVLEDDCDIRVVVTGGIRDDRSFNRGRYVLSGLPQCLGDRIAATTNTHVVGTKRFFVTTYVSHRVMFMAKSPVVKIVASDMVAAMDKMIRNERCSPQCQRIIRTTMSLAATVHKQEVTIRPLHAMLDMTITNFPPKIWCSLFIVPSNANVLDGVRDQQEARVPIACQLTDSNGRTTFMFGSELHGGNWDKAIIVASKTAPLGKNVKVTASRLNICITDIHQQLCGLIMA